MRIIRLASAAIVCLTGLVALHAQEEEGGDPRDEIITDFGLDEYIYTPKMTLRLGMRQLSGDKTSFTGKGTVSSGALLSDYTSAGLTRYYHDGTVFKDTRKITDPDGNTAPINPDGRTNSWSYNFLGQIQDDGTMAFHGYSAVMADPGTISKNGDSSYGVEVVVSRDMKQLTKKLAWTLFMGMSLNQVKASKSADVAATVTTTTDYYSLNGQTPPAPPYLAPSSGVTAVQNPDGTYTTVSTDTTTLLGAAPLGRIVTITPGVVKNSWRVRAGYFTFRVGPSLTYSFTEKFKATASVGGALVFVGSNYTVSEDFKPDVGDDVVKTDSSSTERVLPGFYADATLEYDLTERAGAYAGAFFQDTGSYDQTIASTDSNYATRVDLSRLQGLRLGMNIRF